MYAMRKNANALYDSGYVVSTFAGSGEEGGRDDVKSAAAFGQPNFVAVATNGDIYVADRSNHRVRKIAAHNGIIETIAGSRSRGFKDGLAGDAAFDSPEGIAVAPNGDIIVVDSCNNSIRACSPTTHKVRTIVGKSAGLSRPQGIAVHPDGSIIVADSWNHRIVQVDLDDGTVHLVAGSGQPGQADGEARFARFCKPCGVAVSPNGDIYVADTGNHSIQKICLRLETVTTVGGTGEPGWRDGDAAESQFNDPRGIAVADDGCVYISDSANHCVRVLDPAQKCVATVAGSGAAGCTDSDGRTAQFRFPIGLAFQLDGMLLVADGQNRRIRRITHAQKAEPEIEFKIVDEKLEQKRQQMNELTQIIDNSMASTIAAKKDLDRTQKDTVKASEELVQIQNALKAERLELAAVLQQRVVELEIANGELAKMESAKAERDAECAKAQTELHKAQSAMEIVVNEKEKYAEKLRLVREQLTKANIKKGVRAFKASKSRVSVLKTSTASSLDLRTIQEKFSLSSLQLEEEKPDTNVDEAKENSDPEEPHISAVFQKFHALDNEAQGKAQIEQSNSDKPYKFGRKWKPVQP